MRRSERPGESRMRDRAIRVQSCARRVRVEGAFMRDHARPCAAPKRVQGAENPVQDCLTHLKRNTFFWSAGARRVRGSRMASGKCGFGAAMERRCDALAHLARNTTKCATWHTLLQHRRANRAAD